jgi:carboxymethylenebutenolidase
MSGQYITTVSAKFPHRFACAASLYGVKVVTDQPDSPHLLVGDVQGELYYAFAETDASVPDHVIPDLTAALAKTDVKHTIKVLPGSHHGFQFAERPSYHGGASEQAWSDIFGMLDRHLK